MMGQEAVYPDRKMSFDYDVEEINARYRKLYSALIYDVLEIEFGMTGRAFASGIYPLTPDMKAAGPAFTVHCISTPSRDEYKHTMRLAMLKSMTPGCIQVRDTQGDVSCGQFGEISATAAKQEGCVGAVIDGSTRDSNFLINMGFPTFCRFRNPGEALGRFMAVDYQIPIYVKGLDGQLLIQPGDYIFGDNDGVVVVPRELTVAVLEKAEAMRATENQTRQALLDGMSAIKVVEKYGRF